MKRNKTSRFLSVILALCMLLSIAPMTAGAEQPFTDVSEDAWYSQAVNFCYFWGLMNGTGDGLFSPDAPLTRGMIVTILYRLENEPEVDSGNPFTDVSEGTWYTDAVKWAAANNIVSGYGGGLFGPDDDVTKEQLAVIIYRMALESGFMLNTVGEGMAYTDMNKVSTWAYIAVERLNELNMFINIPGSSFNPQTPATRAEVASILDRYILMLSAASDGYDEDYDYDEEEFYSVYADVYYILANDCSETMELIDNGLIPIGTGETIEIDGYVFYIVSFYYTDEDGDYFETDIICAVSLYPGGVFMYDNELDEWVGLGMG